MLSTMYTQFLISLTISSEVLFTFLLERVVFTVETPIQADESISDRIEETMCPYFRIFKSPQSQDQNSTRCFLEVETHSQADHCRSSIACTRQQEPDLNFGETQGANGIGELFDGSLAIYRRQDYARLTTDDCPPSEYRGLVACASFALVPQSSGMR